jgi:nucleoside-diphosphate-sugar epimerase
MQLKKVIITGASGFIGGKLSERLLKDDVTVYGVGRNAEKLNELKKYGNFVPVIADFADYDKLPELIQERDFDMFWHLAWQGADAKLYDTPGLQIENAAAAVHAATSAIELRCRNSCCCGSNYRHIRSIAAGENPFNPSAYGIAKHAAAEMFKAVAFRGEMPCTNVIFPNTYGPGDKPVSAIVFFIKKLIANEPLNLISGKYQDDWMPIEDLITGILAAQKAGGNYVDYYIGHRQISTFREKLEAMKEILGSKSELNFGAYPEKNYVDYSKFDLNALYRDTAWEAKTDFAESIRTMAEWIKTTKGAAQ